MNHDDFKNKSEEEKAKEIDDFFSKFDTVEEVENHFDRITSNLERDSRKPAVPSDGTADNVQKEPPDEETPSVVRPTGSRLSRLKSEKEKDKNSLIHIGAAIGAQFSGRSEKSKTTAGPSESGDGETGATMAGKRKKKKHYKINKKKLFKFIVSIGLACCVIVGVMVGVIIATTPSINPDDIYSMLSENSVMYDDAGQVVDSIYKGDTGMRTNISYDDMPENLVNAFIAIEDKTFWNHHGFNFVRIFGAIFESITKGEPISGTSTITQQLARNLYLTDSKTERSMVRKIREAWYAIQLETHLNKKQIVEAYLNTIDLGNRSNGVQAASQAYFSKDVSELTLPECALLATIPKGPSIYSPVKGNTNEALAEADVDLDSLDIISRTDDWTTWYNDKSVSSGRYNLVLKFMLEQELISQQEYDEAVAYNIRDSINPGGDSIPDSDISSYLADYTINQVIQDLVEEEGMSEEEARYRLYNGGLRIYSTMNVKMQQSVETIFDDSSNFPSVARLKKDGSGNILDSSGRILLYNKENYMDGNDNFVLSADEYRKNSDGSLTILKGKRLNIYTVSASGETDYNLEFKSMYEMVDGAFYSRTGGVIQIPSEYKSRDEEGNLVISAQFFEDKPDFFTDNGSSLSVGPDHYTLQARTRQPQAAMVIMDQKTGAIKAMVGGRNTEGRQLFNRATSTRQPGSSIKPMGVYAPALQSGANGETDWTAASVIDDAPLTVNGKLWPKNWYSGYRGLYTLRQSVEQSVNVNAVKVFQDIGVDRSVKMLKDFGVTSIVEEGNVNDLNAAALALGGMTNGISPLEMCAGYAVFANDGIYTEPISYTKVTNKNGDVILEKTPETRRVLDEGVAFIMRDILRTTVSNGLAKAANVGTHVTAGKTGTTTDQCDAWFVGFTPLYTASLWIGNDINIELSQGSAAATKVWSKVMKAVHQDLPSASFSGQPSNVVTATIDTKSGKLASEISSLDSRGTVKSEYFVKGTVPTETDDMHIQVDVCDTSGYLATPWCPSTHSRVCIDSSKRDGTGTADAEYNSPTYYCNLHNLDTGAYPVKDGLTVDPNFTWTPSGGGITVPGDGDTSGGGTGNENQGGGNSSGNGSGSDGNGGQTTPPDSGGDNSNQIPDWLNTGN